MENFNLYSAKNKVVLLPRIHRPKDFGANALSDLSLIIRDIYTNYIPNDRSSCALSYETIRQRIGQCLAKLPK